MPTPAPRPLASAIGQALPARSQGFGLLGLIVTIALGAAVTGVAFVAYRQSSNSADVASAASTAHDIANRVTAAYASSPDFSLLNSQAMTRDRLWPGCRPTGACQAPTNPWGGAIIAAGTGAGFAVTFEGVPSDACVKLVTASSTGWAGITVGGTSVMQGRTVQPQTAGTLCSLAPTSTVQFLSSKAASGPLPTLTACVPPAPQAQTIACPAGQLSSVPPYSNLGISQTNQGFCNGAYGLPGVTPWQTIADTCTPACVAPAPTLTPQGQTVGGSATCPAGQVGTDTWQQQQQRVQTVTYACSTPIGPVATNPATYSAWVDVGGRIGEVNTCAPTCATRLGTAPWAPQTQQVGGSAACPPGQLGSDTWQQQQTRHASCASPGTAVDPTWGGWSNTGGRIGEVNTCAPVCVAPAPQTQSIGCPAGQTGSISQQRDASCPAPTGPASWGPWYQTGSTCAPTAPPPPATYGNEQTSVNGNWASGTSSSSCFPQNVGNQGCIYCGFQTTITYGGQSQSVNFNSTSCGAYSQSFSVGGGSFTVTTTGTSGGTCGVGMINTRCTATITGP